jgi:AraC family transcriptional regulator
MVSANGTRRLTERLLDPALPTGISVIASTASVGWSSVHGMVVEGRLEEFHRFAAPDPVVAFHLNAVTQVEWKRGGRYTRFLSQPGALTTVPERTENEFRIDRRSRWLLWRLDGDQLRSIAEQEWPSHAHGSRVEILESFNNRDAELWTLGQRLAARLGAPLPGARLYAEALSTQIAIHLLSNHSSLARRDAKLVERLPDARLRRVVDFIHASLGNEISLGELADLAGLSSNYFLSVFKEATGKTPHRYLTEKRIEKACELLQNPHCSLVDVSLAVGFSSQSHLTTVFRRFMRTTPAAYREAVLGLRQAAAGPEPTSPGLHPTREAEKKAMMPEGFRERSPGSMR